MNAVVFGPNGTEVNAKWGRLGGDEGFTAIIEMAEASGLRHIEPRDFHSGNAGDATTYGTGQLMMHAVRAGCTRLVVGIGGSATTDGGAGMAQALGFRLLDSDGNELPGGGAALIRLERIVAPSPDPLVLCSLNEPNAGTAKEGIEKEGIEKEGIKPPRIEVVAMTDVDNPLCGPYGAAAIYGPQKGVSAEMGPLLDSALRRFASIVKRDLGVDVAEIPGAGAAGGLGAGLIAFCGAQIKPGAEFALDLIGFDAALSGADMVVTGEGRLDSQTARGKGIAEVARRSAALGIPVIALAGSVDRESEPALRKLGITAALTIVDGPCTVEQAMRDGYTLIGAAAERLARLVRWRSSNPRG